MNVGTGALYSTFICLIVGVASIGIFFFLQNKRKKEEVRYSSALDYFSLLLGALWLFIGIGTLFSWLGSPQTHTLFYRWIIGPLTYIHILPAFYYLSWSFLKEKKTYRVLFNTAFTIIALVAIWTHFKIGFAPVGVTYWGTKHKINPTTQKIFTFGLFVPGFLFILADFFRRFKNWRKDSNERTKQLLGFSLGFLAYSIAGFFESIVFVHGWLILLGRIGIMVGPLIFYFFATLEEK